jgi:hypothetical protein
MFTCESVQKDRPQGMFLFSTIHLSPSIFIPTQSDQSTTVISIRPSMLASYIAAFRKRWDSATQSRPIEPPSSTQPLNLSEKYMEVCNAGSGVYGDVSFYLSKDALSTTRSDVEHDAAQASKQLTAKLVVVEVSRGMNLQHLSGELDIIKASEENAPANDLQQRFFQLLAWDTVSPLPVSLVKSTWPICCSLDGLGSCLSSMPEDFLWIVYSQMHEAIEFLHSTCSPLIAHGDLHNGNVIIDFLTPLISVFHN